MINDTTRNFNSKRYSVKFSLVALINRSTLKIVKNTSRGGDNNNPWDEGFGLEGDRDDMSQTAAVARTFMVKCQQQNKYKRNSPAVILKLALSKFAGQLSRSPSSLNFAALSQHARRPYGHLSSVHFIRTSKYTCTRTAVHTYVRSTSPLVLELQLSRQPRVYVSKSTSDLRRPPTTFQLQSCRNARIPRHISNCRSNRYAVSTNAVETFTRQSRRR